MSGGEGAGGSSSGGARGMGRGTLMRLLEQSASSSSDDQLKVSASRDVVYDSGLGTASVTPPAVRGRGKIFDLISSSSSSSSKIPSSGSGGGGGVRGGGGGRGKLLADYKKAEDNKGHDMDTSSDDTYPIGATTGRGRFMEQMKYASSSDKSSDIEKITKSVERVRIETEKEIEPVIKLGRDGVAMNVITNYIRLTSEPNKGVFEYEVKFNPVIHVMKLRHRLLNQHKNELGNAKTFDGTILYLPIKLPGEITRLTSVNEYDNNAKIELSIIFKRQKRIVECMHLYNVLFTRVMRELNYVRFQRKQFDPSAPKLIPQHKLEVWPGYVTAVDEYEGGIMLCLDVSHRVLRQTTVLDMLTNYFMSDRQNFQTNAQMGLLGSVILTRYNNRTYRIDDILFDSNPMSTFETNGKDITYVDYYRTQYNIQIKDLRQPLLVNREDRRISGTKEKRTLTFCLIPELCYFTGLTDEQRNDFRLMRDLATFTRLSPNERLQSLTNFCQKVNANTETKQILKDWGLTLETSPLEMQARQLNHEQIIFRRNQISAGDYADFNKFVTNNEAIETINIDNWLLIHTRKDSNYAKAFIDLMQRCSKPMGITVRPPRVEVLQDDRTETYVQCLRHLINQQLQIVVLICPTSRDDRYAAIKKICCSELPIPSQVINARTLSNDAKNRSIVQKIALQINCKLGGSLWSVKIPFQNVMICGIDSYHDSVKRDNSVSAFVASMNSTYTRWYSRAVVQSRIEEFLNGLCASFHESLLAYKKFNGSLPEKIIIYRDGVGDGQLNMCKNYEIPQLSEACKLVSPDYQPLFTFIVVQKRINTRVFANFNNNLTNPNPGCVLDHTVTRRYLYDFFLIPQSVRQGTVSPTHYVVVHDTADFKPDILQRLSYKLCFLYYNWPGTVRVPACCQYAHKLAFLVGQSVKRQPAEKLLDKLFYL